MTRVDEIKKLLDICTAEERAESLRYLQSRLPAHPIEELFCAKAELILEAIHLSGELTRPMLKGVIAEAAFNIEVASKLDGFQVTPTVGNPSFDVLLEDARGSVRVQVKLQRSKEQQPWVRERAGRRSYVVETQKTRGGVKKGEQTRPYRFGEFDILAVSLFPATRHWDRFRYTIAGWLLPDPNHRKNIGKYQPVAMDVNADWTDDFLEAVEWFRSAKRKRIAPF
ncbi:MAG: hypothetical protein U0793_25520 [Gemmataceae bacterium]